MGQPVSTPELLHIWLSSFGEWLRPTFAGKDSLFWRGFGGNGGEQAGLPR